MKDQVRPLGDQPLRLAGRRKIRCGGSDSEWRSRRRAFDYVVQQELADRFALEAAVFREPLGELAADHASRADDENALYQSGSQRRHHATFRLPPPALRKALFGKFFISTRSAESRRSFMPSAL